MGTNYYVHVNLCDQCNRSEEIHLGKSSAGWHVLLQANGFEYYKTWEGMKEWLADKVIKNEYGDPVKRVDFISLVEGRQRNKELWRHVKNDGQNIPDGFATEDPDGYEFHDGEFS
jgi:hypothetical protein